VNWCTVTEAIHFDARFIRPHQPDGITRFSLGLLAELSKLEVVVALVSDDDQSALLPKGVTALKINPAVSLRELTLGWRLNRAGVKVLFSPMQTTGAIGRKFKLVLTLHDLIYYRHRTPPAFLPLSVRVGWWLFHATMLPQRWLLNRADHIVTVSQTSARQILDHRLTSKPVSVIYNAPAEVMLPTANARHRTLVYMGSFMGYKNVETLIAAVNLLPEYQLQLLSAISPERRAELQNLALRSEQLQFFGGVTEQQYHQLLAQATAMVTASRDEGFGIPVVESMSLGTPVICSDIEVFREIAGGAAEFFDPDDPKGLAEAVKRLEQPSAFETLAAAGLVRSRDFSWAGSAQKLVEILRAL
jgi:glycosyltransferase involved in cell wall biosynthesis